MAKESVVVVDDEEHARNAVSRLLTANGYNVQTLSSGEEAIEYANSHVFDVLLSDFRMPGLDGLTTVRAVRKINPQVVAIIMTGNTSIDLAVQSLNLGVHGFVVKPFHGYELLNTLERTIERQSLINENIKMKALVQVFEATEALITATGNDTDAGSENRLFRLALDFTLRESQATQAALFLLDNDNLEPVGIAYKEQPALEKLLDFNSRTALLQSEYHFSNGNGTSTALAEPITHETSSHIFIQPDLPNLAFYAADGWENVREKAARALEAGRSLLFVDDKQTEYETGRFVSNQQDNCMVAMPMQVQGRKMGVLAVCRCQSEDCFTEVDIQTMAILASQAAIAIDNSRLLRRLVHIEALREADQLRSEFVSTVSHELRTPLTSIKGYATTLLRPDVKWNDATGHDYLGIISEECDKLMSLIDNILEVSKIEAGVLRIYAEPVQILEVIEYAVTEARRRSPEATIILTYPPVEELPLVMADSQRVIQVLRNLLSNAIKYSPERATVEVTMSRPYYEQSLVEDEPAQHVVKISVQDRGFGLSPEHLGQVFERFYRVDVGSARKTEGTGLGLAICKGIIETHGGRIWVESAGPGLGSTFSFTLPVADDYLQIKLD